MKIVRTVVLILLLCCLTGCEQLPLDDFSAFSDRSTNVTTLTIPDNHFAEVRPPKVIRELNQDLERYQPQVIIVEPQVDKTFDQKDVEIKLEVENLPIFQDDQLHLGNHLNLIIDNEPLQEIYNLDQPIVLQDLAPGTHTIRVFAVRPWGESFKNQSAYAQTTFNVLTETNENRPNPELPLLTYGSPTGIYGSEPVLLDFYLNTPHGDWLPNNLESQKWLVKATVNGISLIIEDWQPYYLTGFEPGDNWIQLELIDESGNTIENTFNNTVRVFTYDPQQHNNLARLINNEISVANAKGIIDQNYYIQSDRKPEVVEPNIEPESIILNEESANDLESTTEEAQEIESRESDITDQTIPQAKNNLISTSSSDTEQVETEKLEQPKTLTTEEITDLTIDKVFEVTEDTLVTDGKNSVDAKDLEEKTIVLEPTESAEVSTTPQDSLDLSPPNTVATDSQPESTKDEISTNPKKIEPITKTADKIVPPVWWKKILISLRHKLEGLIRLLPNEV